MDAEALGVKADAHRVAYQGEGDHEQRQHENAQHQGNPCHIGIERLHEALLAGHLVNQRRSSLKRGSHELEAVGLDILRLEAQLHRNRHR